MMPQGNTASLPPILLQQLAAEHARSQAIPMAEAGMGNAASMPNALQEAMSQPQGPTGIQAAAQNRLDRYAQLPQHPDFNGAVLPVQESWNQDMSHPYQSQSSVEQVAMPPNQPPVGIPPQLQQSSQGLPPEILMQLLGGGSSVEKMSRRINASTL